MKPGQQIKEARIRKGMTQQELADKTSINVRTIQRIENEEVLARAYSIKMIASVLELEPQTLMDNQESETAEKEGKVNKVWLAFLHLSGFLLLPTVMIWIFEKKRIQGVRKHVADIINFQLTMLVFLIPVLPLAFLPILIAIFTSVIIIVNTIKVIADRPYHYPFTISFLKG